MPQRETFAHSRYDYFVPRDVGTGRRLSQLRDASHRFSANLDRERRRLGLRLGQRLNRVRVKKWMEENRGALVAVTAGLGILSIAAVFVARKRA